MLSAGEPEGGRESKERAACLGQPSQADCLTSLKRVPMNVLPGFAGGTGKSIAKSGLEIGWGVPAVWEEEEELFSV
uniref:Uncharacterized protein n=1 Tax=Sphaerodactylus townsendi TaxID=933632 RepID=A0ACB8EV56_9SAUR